MSLTLFDIGTKVIKDDTRYLLKDNNTLNSLVLSSTELRGGQETRGHKHPGQEEVYIFVYGKGRMIVDENEFEVNADDVVLIPDGVFHKVINTDPSHSLYFVTVFNGKRNH